MCCIYCSNCKERWRMRWCWVGFVHILWFGPALNGKLWPVEHLLIYICTVVDKNHHQVYCPDCFICWGMGLKWDAINSCEPKSTLSINLVIVTQHISGGSGGSFSSVECEVREMQWSYGLPVKAGDHTGDLSIHGLVLLLVFSNLMELNTVWNRIYGQHTWALV